MSKVITVQDGDLTFDVTTGNILANVPLLVQEQATANADVAGYGQVWIKSDTPNTLYFTDDVGTDFAVSGSSVPTVTALGTPVNNQIAVWTDADTIEGDASLTWEGSGTDRLTLTHNSAGRDAFVINIQSATSPAITVNTTQVGPGEIILELNPDSGTAGFRLETSWFGVDADHFVRWRTVAGSDLMLLRQDGYAELAQVTFDQPNNTVQFGADVIEITERAAQNTPSATIGQLWVRSDAPNVLVFTDDVGTDFVIGGAGGGNVNNTGTPVNNQLAVWTDATTIEGDANFTWTGTTLAIAGAGAQLLLPFENDAVTPTLAFGDGDTGFYENADDTIYISTAGTARWGITSGAFAAVLANGPQIRNIVPTATVPNFNPRGSADPNTGIGSPANNQLSLITNAVEANRIIAATVQTPEAAVTEIISIPVASGEGFGFEVHVMGTQDLTGHTVFERIFGAIRNQGGTTALVGSTIVDRTDDAEATTWVISVEADDTGDALTVDVTGEASHTIDWKVRVELLNV